MAASHFKARQLALAHGLPPLFVAVSLSTVLKICAVFVVLQLHGHTGVGARGIAATNGDSRARQEAEKGNSTSAKWVYVYNGRDH